MINKPLVGLRKLANYYLRDAVMRSKLDSVTGY